MAKHGKKSQKRTRRQRGTRRRGNARRRLMYGGGQGAGWTIGPAVAPGAPYAQTNQPYDACLQAPRPGAISYSDQGGLPGMSPSPVMKGGRYTNNLAAGDIGGFAQIDKVPCEPNWKNPLNQAGGGSGGLHNASDMGVYEAPTARYTHSPSQWTSSVGAPVLLNVPMDAKLWSKACTQTGGKRRKGRKGRKSRHSTRRQRK